MPALVRVNDTATGFCQQLDSQETAVFEAADNVTKVFCDSQTTNVVRNPAIARPPCGNEILFTNGSPTVFINGGCVFRVGDTGICQTCGNTFTINTGSPDANAG